MVILENAIFDIHWLSVHGHEVKNVFAVSFFSLCYEKYITYSISIPKTISRLYGAPRILKKCDFLDILWLPDHADEVKSDCKVSHCLSIATRISKI